MIMPKLNHSWNKPKCVFCISPVICALELGFAMMYLNLAVSLFLYWLIQLCPIALMDQTVCTNTVGSRLTTHFTYNHFLCLPFPLAVVKSQLRSRIVGGFSSNHMLLNGSQQYVRLFYRSFYRLLNTGMGSVVNPNKLGSVQTIGFSGPGDNWY